MFVLSPEPTGLFPEWLRWLFAALAVYRLSQLVALDDGPWDWLLRFRTWAGCYDRGENGEPMTTWGKLFECPYCLAVWFALPVLILVLTASVVGDMLLAWWGLAGAQALMEGRDGKS